MVSDQTLILISGGSAIIGAIIGSCVGGIINYKLQKTDKKDSFRFEQKKKLYIKIDEYIEDQLKTVGKPLNNIIHERKFPLQKELRNILQQVLENIKKIDVMFYGKITGGVINKNILREVKGYQNTLFDLKKKSKIDYDNLYLRTNKHANIIKEIICKELGIDRKNIIFLN